MRRAYYYDYYYCYYDYHDRAYHYDYHASAYHYDYHDRAYHARAYRPYDDYHSPYDYRSRGA